ncbi:MAG: heavy metal translocating P-type ATPase [Candidatus Promineofilum sp.]|nr:heavy metal translocating P-type ATPase [Promineifilum sp.]
MRADDLSPSADRADDPSCLQLLDQAVAGRKGIVNVAVDTADETITFAYDPHRVAEDDILRVAHDVAPALQERWERCTLRLEKRGGRACESCALALERQVGRMPGVRRATASFNGGVMAVHYDSGLITFSDIAQRVEQFGVGVAPSAADLPGTPSVGAGLRPAPTTAPTTAIGRARAWLTPQRLQAILTVVTLVTMLAAWLLERTATGPAGLVSALYVAAFVAGGAFGLKGGIESLLARTIDIDLLMILAALGAAYVGEPFEGAMLLFLFSLSNTLQDFALDRTRNAIRALMKLRPDTAAIYRGERLVTLPIEQVRVGDRMLVKPGDRIALDGTVLSGAGSVDQASLTGESMPVYKKPGDPCFAGTINQDGSLEIGVTKLAKDSTLARLIRLVEEAQSEKAETQRFIDKFEQWYALGVIVLTAAVAALLPLLFGRSFDAAFYTAMTVMVAASPCAIVISTPATVLSAIGNGARRGVLFKGGIHVENAATVRAVAFDKTGTLTEGKPVVTDVSLFDDEFNAKAQSRQAAKEETLASLRPGVFALNASDDLLRLAAAVEARSQHPLAAAIVAEAKARGQELPPVSHFQAVAGQGVRGVVDDPALGRVELHIGNPRYFAANGLPETVAETVAALEDEGKTSVIVAAARPFDGRGTTNQVPGSRGQVPGEERSSLAPDSSAVTFLGVIALADRLRPDAPAVVRELKAAGVGRVIMLTGDNRRVAERIAAQAGVDEVFADLLPEDKVTAIRQVRDHYGPVAMVGDGVNDAPALAAATIGIAMGAAGTDVALETADIVLMSDNLANIPYVIRLSRATRRTLIVNLGFALFMIALMLLAIFARDLPLPLAVIGHEGGTVLVSLNGLRLLGYRDRPA